MATPVQKVVGSLDPFDLIELQRRHIARAQAGMGLRQRRILRRALADVDRRLARARTGSWGEAEATATKVMLGQAMQHAVGQLELDLGQGLSEVTKMAAKDAARVLSTLDQKYLGAVRPLRFDTFEWWESTDKRIGQVRLRQFSRSYRRYGGAAVAAIEDELAQRMIVGESWDKARQRVWEATHHVVGDKQWMVDRILRTEVAAAYNGTTLSALYEEDTDEEPMLKKLVATFDGVTGMDSYFVHGQTRKLTDQFQDDHGRIYDAPPNRPHDREIVAGWRKSWGAEGEENMEDFDEATAKPRDDEVIEEWEPPETVTPPAPQPTDIPPLAPAANADDLTRRLGFARVQKAAAGLELQTLMQSRIILPKGITHPPETVAMAGAHNLAIEQRIEALRQQIREAQEEQARIQLLIRQRKQAEAKRAVAGERPVLRLPPPKAISKVEGPGKAKPPAPKLDLNAADVKAGQWVDLNGVPMKIDAVEHADDVVWLTIKVRGHDLRFPLPGGQGLTAWTRKPSQAASGLSGLDEALHLSRWSVQVERWSSQFLKDAFEKKMRPSYAQRYFHGHSQFEDDARKAMLEILEGAKVNEARLLSLGEGKVPTVQFSGRGTEAVKAKHYLESKGFAIKAKMSGLDRGLATEYVSEWKALFEGVRWRPDQMAEINVVKRSKGRLGGSFAWVATYRNVNTGRVGKMTMNVNSHLMQNRERAGLRWHLDRADMKEGRHPMLAAAHWDEADAMFRTTVRHEFGHVVDNTLKDRALALADDSLFAQGIKDVFAKGLRETPKRDLSAMSRYATESPEEAFAEAFSLAVSGKWESIPEKLRQALRLALFPG